MSKSTKEILCEARDLLKGKWIQGSYEDIKGCHCAVGALRKVAEASADYDNYYGALSALNSVINPEFTAASSSAVINFNDDPTRTEEEVLALFEEAASRA